MDENLSTSGSEDENSGDDVENVVRAGEILNVTKIKGERKDGELYKTGDLFLFHTAKRLYVIIIIFFFIDVFSTKIYELHFRKTSVLYRCRCYKSHHCQARLIKRDGVYRKSGLPHSHPNEAEDIGRIEFVNECCRRVIEQRAPGGLKRIFEQVRHE
jgi:hypothetical protein